MPTVVVVGSQWGDEAKGKLVDCLASDADLVVRFGGGSNAGHTVRFAGKEFKLHLVPSGIFRSDTRNIIASGVVVDPASLVSEINGLRDAGVCTDRLFISRNAHVVLPYHRLLDRLEENARGAGQIGTTGRGIGPAYVDKTARCGVRMRDLISPKRLRERLERIVPLKHALIANVYHDELPGIDALLCELEPYAAILAPFVCDTEEMLQQAVKTGQRVVFEGAQGALLDLDHGTYPFVTSSHPVAGGACLGTGIGPTAIDGVLGVAKAYSTRVGSGPFPTEQLNRFGEYLREKGHEYGTTTGRPRRCGWLDTVVLRYSVQINGMTGIALSLVDVLSGLEEIAVCSRYRKADGTETSQFEPDGEELALCSPVYEYMAGWQDEITEARCWDDLPTNAQRYVETVEKLVGVPVVAVSVGPSREQTIWRHGVDGAHPLTTMLRKA